MAGGLVACIIAAHPPRMGVEERVPPFQRALVEGEKELGHDLMALRPDVLVVQSTHWVSTFNWYATAQAHHRGICVAHEAPDLMPGTPYDRRGDRDFALAFSDAVRAAGYPCGVNETEHYALDYGTLVPLQYLDPHARLPLVSLPVVLKADIAESMKIGELVHNVGVTQGKRVAFLASTALSHELVRGPEQWPTAARQDMDRALIARLLQGEVEQAIEEFPHYAKAAVAEMGGRVLAALLGALRVLQPKGLVGRQYGPYTQSSGSGNANLLIRPLH